MQQTNGDQSVAVLNNDSTSKPAQEQKTPSAPDAVPFFSLFRFADRTDYILIIVGSIFALALGAALPCFVLFWGDMTDAFGQSGQGMVDASKIVLLKLVYLGIGAFCAGWIMVSFWMIAGQRQATKCRKIYFNSLLEQQIGWFDCTNQSQLSTQFQSDTFAFQSGIGEKVATMIQLVGICIAGFVIAFIKGWVMTLVVVASLPVIAFAGYVYITVIQTKDKQTKKFYAKAGGISEQAISSIKTVKQLNGEAFQQQKFRTCLQQSIAQVLKFSLISAMGFAGLNSASLLSYSLGFWYGSNCVEGNSSCPSSVNGGGYTVGNVLVVFFSVLVAGMNLSQLSPAMSKIAQAKAAAARIFKIIDRQPLIKSPPNGLKPTQFIGNVKLQNVTFAYPKDKSTKILNNLTIEFHKNSSALVGESGCGKSTILQLLMRFYDPDEGRVLIDGHDLRQLDLVWLREKIGYVGQEPVLFAASIRQNLMLGNQNATQEDIDDALKQAEAYSFINQNLEDKLETFVGVGGGQLSGGQKQRIAIARALLKKPKILLLDQATSALDRRNERLIQNTLNKISKGLTTITVAHRVKTIMSSELIYVLSKGKIQQKGSFYDLHRYKDYKEQKEEDFTQNDQQVLQKAKDNTQGKVNGNLNLIQSPQTQALTKQQKQKQRKEQLIKKHQKNVFRRVFSYNRNYIGIFVLAIIFALILGLVYPCFAIFLSKVITTLIQFKTDPVQSRKQANLDALVFLLLAIGSFIIMSAQNFIFAVVGQEVTRNLRNQTYLKILKMPVPWFDYPQNSTGVLANRLAIDCQTVNGMITNYVGIVVQCLSTLIAGIIIAFVYEWRTSLISLALMPLLVLASALRAGFRTGLVNHGEKAYRDSQNLIMESMINIRTVVSFGVENTVMNKYNNMIDQPYKFMLKTGIWTGFTFGLSQILMFVVFAIIFYIGTLFVRDDGVSILDVFTAIYAIFFAAVTVGNNSHFMPDIADAKLSAASLFQILDSQDEDQMQIRQQSKLLKTGINGNIKLQGVAFKYESRNTYVFENMNVQIKQGQKVAFVGTSGCGKSTIMQLLLRFYRQDRGSVTIDGEDIKDYEIHYLRSKFGVVSQQPVLFNGTFRENIKYNLADATEQQIREAATMANALSFIEGDEKLVAVINEHADKKDEVAEEEKGTGFDKNVGIKGSHISGGQKQRIAVARAILRNPQILLLDEATSALDSVNQKKVQDSLDKMMVNKTTISIAHRIDTIKNSDDILVFQKGEIVEKGTYASLLEKKGYFFNLERGTQFV